MKKMNNKGFSLVELIIVIAIMAVLIGILAPQFIKFVEKSRESTDLQNIEEMKTAVETYVADKSGDSSVTIPAAITVTLDKGAKTIKCSETGVDDYGVVDMSAKSGKWSSNVVWSYNTSTYKWTAPTAGIHADFYNADGTDYKAPTT